MGYWWTSTVRNDVPLPDNYAFVRFMSYYYNGVGTIYQEASFKSHGYSVRCVREVFNITYHGIGNVDNTNNPTTYDGRQITLSVPSGDSLGYTFGGWFTDASFLDTVSTPAIELLSTGNKEFYAKWLDNSTADADGNIYRSEKIGNQIWMAENLRTTSYADGTPIPLVTDNTAWATLGDNNIDKGYSWYDNDISNRSNYGALYTWAAASNGSVIENTQGICPTGWHLPSDAEWTTLENYISNDGYSGTEGTALKAIDGWDENNNGDGINAYGFTALPGGYRSESNGMFYNDGSYGYWWSRSQDNDDSRAYSRRLNNYAKNVGRLNYVKSTGYSVRCVKGDGTPTPYNITYHNIGNVDNTNNPITYDGSEDVTLSIPAGDSTGFTFAGWYTDAAFTDTITTPAITAGSTINKVYYAKWLDNSTVDADGNKYRSVKIGTQTWMAENLRSTTYADGTPIPLVTNNTSWLNLGDNNTDKAYCWHNNDISNKDTYGALYSWAAATNGNSSGNNTQGVCPSGWHLPSDAEWTTLVNYISNDGFSGIEGTALQAISGFSGTDDYDFTALPGSYRKLTGLFGTVGNDGWWWSSTQYSAANAYYRRLYKGNSEIIRDDYYKSNGYSVRCVKNSE